MSVSPRDPCPPHYTALPAVEQDRLRASVAARLFGGEAQPLKIGRHTVLKRLGSGGQGIVYAAYDETLDRKVAIKVLHRPHNPSRLPRLQQEAQALARVSHPNVVSVYEVGTHEGQVYIAMEHLPGQRLAQLRYDPARPLAQQLQPWIDAAQGLAAMHKKGLVHRDFKPSNAMSLPDGRVKLFDFGLATPQSEDRPKTKRAAVGTPTFMPPEQRESGDVDARADQYSYCLALWAFVSGRPPEELIHEEARTRPRHMPKWLYRVLRTGLGQRPEQRHASMDPIIDALKAGQRAPGRRRRRALALAGVAGIALAFGALAQREDPCQSVEQRWDSLLTSLDRSRPAAATGGVREKVLNRLTAFAGRARKEHLAQCQLATEHPKTHAAAFASQSPCYVASAQTLADIQAQIPVTPPRKLSRWLKAPLPSLSACKERARSASIDLDPKVRGRLEQGLAKAQVQLSLRRHDPAQTLATEVLQAPEAQKLPALAAKAHLIRARARRALAKLDQAQADLDIAYRLAESLDDDDLRLEALVLRAKVASAKGAHQKSSALMHDAHPLAQRPGVSVHQRVEYFSEACRIDRMQDDLCFRYQKCQEGLRLLAKSEAAPVQLNAMTRRLAWTLYEAGRVDQAVALASKAGQDLRQTLGLPEDSVLTLHGDALELTLRAEQLRIHNKGLSQWQALAADAKEVYDRYIEVYGEQSPAVIVIRSNYAEFLLRAGKPDQAKALFETLLAQQAKDVGRYFPLLMLGRIHLQAGQQVAPKKARSTEDLGKTQLIAAISLIEEINRGKKRNAIPELGLAHFALAQNLGPTPQGIKHAQKALRAYQDAENMAQDGDPACASLRPTHERYPQERRMILNWFKENAPKARPSPREIITARR